MKSIKTSILFCFGVFLLVTITFYSCKKKQTEPIEGVSIYYSSMQDFIDKNGVKKETFTIDAAIGGSFISVKGTTVNIPANAFKDSVGNVITGIINFEFKDIYKKSEMILSDMATNCDTGPMLSAGEFFLKASQNNLKFVSTKTITILQPTPGLISANMGPFYLKPDSTNQTNWDWFGSPGSFPLPYGGLNYSAQTYAYSIFPNYFSSSGNPNPTHWYNTDDPYAFSSYPQTTLTIINPDNSFQPFVYLIFNSVNSAVRVYNTGGYFYNFAPVGLQATVFAIAIKDNKLYSSIIPITISSGQIITLNLKLNSTADLTTSLKALD